MSESPEDSRQERQRLLEANVAAVDAEVAAAIARGMPLRDIVAVVADLREPLARPFVAAAAKARNVTEEVLLERIATPFGQSSRISTSAIARSEAVAHFDTSYPQLAQALANFPTTDRFWIVVIAAGSAALVSRAPKGACG